MARKAHQCEPAKPVCCCSMIADEPSWKCPIHGGAVINRCECGRFVRHQFYGEHYSADAVPEEDADGD